MVLYPFHWDLKEEIIIKTVKQFYNDLYSSNSEQYWNDEGNNKRMQQYFKISIVLKYLKYLMFFITIIYVLYLSTNSIYCLYEELHCCSDNINIIKSIDFKQFIYNTYVITFVMMMFVVFYYSRKSKIALKSSFKIIAICLLFLPISALLNYNFVILGSLMSSFYLVVAILILTICIDSLNCRINKLYKIATEGNEEEVKVEVVQEKEMEIIKNARKNKFKRNR